MITKNPNVAICYNKDMKRLMLAVLMCVLSFGVVGGQVLAAPRTVAKDPIGYDISWPQCGKRLPTNQAFGIVGVNGGLANNTNPCLSTQLTWANRSIGGANQPLIQLYVNTANPGGLGTASWPVNNIDPAGNMSPNPFAQCDNSDSLACAWQYGWNRAVEDNLQRFVPSATTAGVNTSASAYTWWLDVETENTWKSGSAFAMQSNVAVLEGMTAYFKQLGAKVGLYSTGLQWSQIVGSAVSGTSNLNGLPNWRPSGASLNNAKANCSVEPLTAGGIISLTQFVIKGLDNNYSCI